MQMLIQRCLFFEFGVLFLQVAQEDALLDKLGRDDTMSDEERTKLELELDVVERLFDMSACKRQICDQLLTRLPYLRYR